MNKYEYDDSDYTTADLEHRHPDRYGRRGDERPCGGKNSNICVAEGCYGESCIYGRAGKPTTFPVNKTSQTIFRSVNFPVGKSSHEKTVSKSTIDRDAKIMAAIILTVGLLIALSILEPFILLLIAAFGTGVLIYRALYKLCYYYIKRNNDTE